MKRFFGVCFFLIGLFLVTVEGERIHRAYAAASISKRSAAAKLWVKKTDDCVKKSGLRYCMEKY